MGAKNFGRKKDSAKVKRAKRREKKLKALRFAGINVDVKEKDENGETTMMTTENDETEVSTTLSKKEKSERYAEEKRTQTGDDIDEREEEERGEKNERNFTENALEKHSKDEERTRRIGLEKEEGRRRE